MKSRAILLFENSIKSESTKKTYNYCLKKFVEYYKLKGIDSLITIESKVLQTMFEDYLFYQKKNVRLGSIRTHFAAFDLFCIVNEIEGLNFRKIRKMFPALERKQGRNAWPTQSIQKMLEATKELRTKTLIHFLASSGCRIGAIPDLKIGNLTEMPEGCLAVVFYEGTNDEYVGFLTPEAAKFLRKYLEKRTNDGEKLDKNHPLFRERYAIGIAKPRSITQPNFRTIIHRLIKTSGIEREKSDGRFDIMSIHGFRKRFNTILKLNKEINPAIAEKLMGHKVALDSVYLTPTRDDLFNEFKKAILDLTISDSDKLKLRNEKLEEEKSELESKTEELGLHKDEFDRLKQVVENLLKEKESKEDNNTDEIKRNRQTIDYLLKEVKKLKS